MRKPHVNWRVVIGCGLALAACIFGWSAWNHRAPESLAVAAPGDRPDYVMHDFELVALGADGTEAVTLRGPLLQRSALDHSSTITAPLFLIPDDKGNHWQMRAKTGWVSEKGDELRLHDDVVGTSPDGIGTPTTFTTTWLNVYPKQDLAMTDAQATITQPGSILIGTGFSANTKTRNFSFKSQVHSRYAPKRR